MTKQPLVAISVLLWSVSLIAATQAHACPAGYYSWLGTCLPGPPKINGEKNQTENALEHAHRPNPLPGPFGPVAAPSVGRPPPTPAHPLGPPGNLVAALVWDTGYSALTKPGGEEAGYGLYSYVIAPGRTRRNAKLLLTILAQVPRIEDTGSDKSDINVLYIPVKPEKQYEFNNLKAKFSFDGYIHNPDVRSMEADAISIYDQSMALGLLHRICASATGDIAVLCKSDTSEGPFLFTYARPVTALHTVPPPYLIVDLRPVHERAFPVFISKFMEQVKRPHFSDGKRIHTFKLSLLNIILKAADWIEPVQKATAGIVHTTGDEAKDGK